MKEIFEPIRDHYCFAEPSGELAGHVDFFSESIVADQAFTVEMFPSWTPTMYVNLGNPYSISLGKRTFAVPQWGDIAVLRDTATVRHNLPGDRIFTIKFHPGGLQAVLGICQLALRGRVAPLSQLLPPQLICGLKSAKGFSERKDLAESYLLSQLRTGTTDHYAAMVADISQGYVSSAMRPNVSELAERYFLTSKTINRYFHRVVGTGPKDYFSILRARASLQGYVQERGGFDPTGFGYHDASHFYREAARFLGFPLRDIASSR